MSKTLYLECNSGISGDMTVGALLDLGADRAKLEAVIESMGLEGYKLHFGRTKKCGIDAYDFDVKLYDLELELARMGLDNVLSAEKQSAESPSLESERGHCGCGHHHNHQHTHSHHCGHHHHDHEHHHEHHDCEDSHEHRNIHEIYDIIEKSSAADRAKALAKKIFDIVAEAESRAHGVPVEEVHFHEVGAVDSIIDIVGAAVCIDDLGIENVAVSPLAEGSGYVWCDHGIMPVPVPAVLNIAMSHRLILKTTENKGEMVTPTGAAIAAALKNIDKLPKNYRVIKTGLGAGNKDFQTANILRAMLIEETEDKLWQLETNLDDCTGEAMGFTMEKLLEAGAADVWYTPIYMKKNRPAYMLSVLCREADIEKIEDIIFSNTTTIGIRRFEAERTVLSRRVEAVDVDITEGVKKQARVKLCRHKGKMFVYPEYESVKALAEEFGMDFKQAEEIVREAGKKLWS